jgi:hypothetical protein
MDGEKNRSPAQHTANGSDTILSKGKGWNAAVAKGNGAAGADMTITGKLVDVGVDAKSGIGQTTLNAKSRNGMNFVSGIDLN